MGTFIAFVHIPILNNKITISSENGFICFESVIGFSIITDGVCRIGYSITHLAIHFNPGMF